MDSPRLKAAVFIGVLLAVCAFLSIWILNTVGVMITHGTTVVNAQDGTAHTVEHSAGTIIQLANDQKSFVLMTAAGQQQTFQCTKRCLSQIGHMQRHINERAKTDIYYIKDAATGLVAIDVD